MVGRAAVRARRLHTEAKLQEMGIELPVPKPPLGKAIHRPVRRQLNVQNQVLNINHRHVYGKLEGS